MVELEIAEIDTVDADISGGRVPEPE